MCNTGKLPIVFGILFTRDKILQKKAKKRVVRAKPKDRWIILKVEERRLGDG